MLLRFSVYYFAGLLKDKIPISVLPCDVLHFDQRKEKKKDGFKKKSTLPATPFRPPRVADVAVIGTPVAESPEVRDVP